MKKILLVLAIGIITLTSCNLDQKQTVIDQINSEIKMKEVLLNASSKCKDTISINKYRSEIDSLINKRKEIEKVK